MSDFKNVSDQDLSEIFTSLVENYEESLKARFDGGAGARKMVIEAADEIRKRVKDEGRDTSQGLKAIYKAIQSGPMGQQRTADVIVDRVRKNLQAPTA